MKSSLTFLVLLLSQAIQVFGLHKSTTTLAVSPTSTAFDHHRLAQQQQQQRPKKRSTVPTSVLAIRGGDGGVEDFVGGAYDWCVNLGAPAALVAGAVVATLYENVRGGELAGEEGDTTYTSIAKKATGLLLLSAFACQIVSIFVTTVTGTMLLSRDFSNVEVKATTALGFLKEQFEFEYLTSRICFLQGLVNWLSGVALEHTIPREEQGKEARNMDLFVATSLGTLVAFLLSFYNAHLSFYDNYYQMLARWATVTFNRYFNNWPPRPLMLCYLPGILYCAYTLTKAIFPEKEKDN